MWGVAGVVAAAALLLVALPYVASARIVRDRIAVEMSAWSGYRVRIGAPPTVSIWPSLRAVLTEVSFSEWGETASHPVLSAAQIDVELSAMAALRGDAVLTSVRLVRPELHVEAAGGGLVLPNAPGGGRMAQAIDRMRRAADDRREESLPADAFGSIGVSDGRIVLDTDGTATPLLTDLQGSIDWPALNRAGRIVAQGRWRGQAVSLDLRADHPLLFMAGAEDRIEASLSAAQGSLTFSGKAKPQNPFSLDGTVHFSTGSLRDLAAWLGTDIPGKTQITALGVAGDIQGDVGSIKLRNADIAINGNRGRGALELTRGGTAPAPALSGSLAFDELDLGAALGGLAPLTELPAAASALPVAVDLRLSARHAKIAALALTDVAATAQVRDRLAAFDISDATVFGGTLQAGLRFDRQPQGTEIGLRMLASDIDGGAFGAAAGMTKLIPVGRGTISVILKGRGGGVEDMLRKADGSVSANFGQGALTKFDLQGFLQRSKSGGFFALDDVSGGNMPVDAVDLEATVSNGVAHVQKGEARFQNRRIWISGIVPYVERGLALNGGVGPVSANGAPGPDETDFFVGGTWSSPFVSPAIADTPIE